MRLVVVLAFLVSATPVYAQGPSQQPMNLPNLVPRPPYEIQIGSADNPVDGRALRFTVAAQNLGVYPFEVLGLPNDLSQPLAGQNGKAYQCVEWVSYGCISRRPTAVFAWDPLHDHYHVNDFSRYELRDLNPDGTPDMTTSGLVASTEKVSYCLEDVQETDSWQPSVTSTGFYLTCNGYLQGISSQWSDIYVAPVGGQQILLRGVSDGNYALVVRLNPDGYYFETTRSDDVSFRRIALSDSGTRVSVLP